MPADRDQALRDLARTATIYLMAVDAPDLLEDRTVEEARAELQDALSQAELALDQPARPAGRPRHEPPRRSRRR